MFSGYQIWLPSPFTLSGFPILYWITPATQAFFAFSFLSARSLSSVGISLLIIHSLLNFLIPGSAASFMHNVLVWTMRFNLFLICFFSSSRVIMRGLDTECDGGRAERYPIPEKRPRVQASTRNLYRANNYKWEFIDSELIRPARIEAPLRGQEEDFPINELVELRLESRAQSA